MKTKTIGVLSFIMLSLYSFSASAEVHEHEDHREAKYMNQLVKQIPQPKPQKQVPQMEKPVVLSGERKDKMSMARPGIELLKEIAVGVAVNVAADRIANMLHEPKEVKVEPKEIKQTNCNDLLKKQ